MAKYFYAIHTHTHARAPIGGHFSEDAHARGTPNVTTISSDSFKRTHAFDIVSDWCHLLRTHSSDTNSLFWRKTRSDFSFNEFETNGNVK